MISIEPYKDDILPERFLRWIETLRIKLRGIEVGPTGLGVWAYRTATDAFPAAGRLQFDNVAIGSATNFYLNVTNAIGTDMSAFLASIASGDLIYVQIQADSGTYVVIRVGVPALAAGVYTFPITAIVGEGTAPTNNTSVAVITG